MQMLEDNYDNALLEAESRGIEEPPLYSFNEFIELINSWAEQTPLTEALCFVDNLLVNFDYYAFLFPR